MSQVKIEITKSGRRIFTLDIEDSQLSTDEIKNLLVELRAKISTFTTKEGKDEHL